MLKSMWKSAVEVIVEVVGGRYDGSRALCTNLAPGTVMNLHTEKYAIEWKNGQPRLAPVLAK